jgi:hypothetical protein
MQSNSVSSTPQEVAVPFAMETLLKLDQKVVGLDNFSTGHRIPLTILLV